MQNFNFPTPDDPNFNQKVLELLKNLFDKSDKKTLDLSPIITPQEGNQIGTIWFDSSDETIKVNTSIGVKTVQYL